MSDQSQSGNGSGGGNGTALVPVTAGPAGGLSREQVEMAKLQAEAAEANIRAIGEQVRFLAESPGVKAMMGDFGRAMVLKAEIEKARTENEHAQKMQLDRMNADAQKRREILGVTVLLGGGAIVSGVLFVGIYMVQMGWLSPDSAKWLGGLVATLLVGLGLGRKSTPAQ